VHVCVHGYVCACVRICIPAYYITANAAWTKMSSSSRVHIIHTIKSWTHHTASLPGHLGMRLLHPPASLPGHLEMRLMQPPGNEAAVLPDHLYTCTTHTHTWVVQEQRPWSECPLWRNAPRCWGYSCPVTLLLLLPSHYQSSELCREKGCRIVIKWGLLVLTQSWDNVLYIYVYIICH